MNEFISLCGCNPPGCPSFKIEGDTIIIKDDFGGSVKMPLEEYAELHKLILEEI